MEDVSCLSVAFVAFGVNPLDRTLLQVTAREQNWSVSESCRRVKLEVDAVGTLSHDAALGFLDTEEGAQGG